MKTVYLPGFTGLPRSSLPSHFRMYFPAERVALEMECAMSGVDLNFDALYQARNSGRKRFLLNHTASVRTESLSGPSIQMATYGRSARKPSEASSTLTHSS